MFKLTISCVALIGTCCLSHAALAGCKVDDDNFATAGGGCKDLSTGVVWSPDVRALGNFGGGSPPNANTTCGYFRDANFGGFSDWRAPTLKEVQTALANGLNSHLDFFDDGGVKPDDGVYRWTSCLVNKGKGTVASVRFTDGHVLNQDHSANNNPPYVWQICVRGKPSPNDCGPGKKNRIGAARSLSQTATGALLLLPLGVVLAARCLRPRP